MTLKQIECKLAELQACCKPDEVNLAKIHLAGLSAGSYKWGINTQTGDVFYNLNGYWELYTSTGNSNVEILDSTSINVTGNGTVTTPLSASVILSSTLGNTLQSTPTGLYVPPPVIPPSSIIIQDTLSVDLVGNGTSVSPLSANVIISPTAGNSLILNPNGLFVPTVTITTQDTNTVDLSSSVNPLTANIKISSIAGNTITAQLDGIYATGGTPVRFGIEDNLGIQNRSVNMGQFNFEMTDAGYIDLIASDGVDPTFGELWIEKDRAYIFSGSNASTATVDTGSTYVTARTEVANVQYAMFLNDSGRPGESILQTTDNINGIRNIRVGTDSVRIGYVTEGFDLTFPDITANRYSPISVNNNYADATGNITISTDSGPTITVADTNTINLSLPASELTADVIISPTAYNITQALSDGVYSTPMYTLTKAQADTAVTNSTLIPGQEYKITGVDSTLFGGTDIILKAASPNAFENTGRGLFYNPKYNQTVADYGIWHNTSSFVSSAVTGTFATNAVITNNLGGTGVLYGNIAGNRFVITGGTWVGATSITATGASANIASIVITSYALGSTIIWGGKHWTNTSGNPGTAPTNATLSGADWTVIPYDAVNYNAVWDSIDYDYANDLIVRRADSNGNIVHSTKADHVGWNGANRPINLFQWGNPYVESTLKGCGHNQIIGGYCDNMNHIGCTAHNIITSKAYFYQNRAYIGHMIGNVLSGGANISTNTLVNSSINNNQLSQGNNNNAQSPCTIASNIMSGSYINSNTLKVTSAINSNTITAAGYIYNNNMSMASTINSNRFTGGFIYGNTMTSSCVINSNIMSGTASIGLNILNNSCQMNSNTVGGNGGLFYNVMNDTCQMNSNISTNGNIRANTMLYACKINTNTLGTGSFIYINTMTSSSQINSNNLVSYGYIVRNVMSGFSFMDTNTLTGGSNSNDPASLSTNMMSSGDITGNTLTGVRADIYGNNLITPIGYTDFPGRCKIINNTINAANGRIELNTLEAASIIQAVTITTATLKVRKIHLYAQTFDLGNVNLLRNYEFTELREVSGRHVFDIVFDGTSGKGAIGTITLPNYQVPAGYYVEEVITDVGAGLTGAGAKINLGIATDGVTSALNDTTGDVTTLNAGVTSRISPSTYIKSTGSRVLVGSVGTAAITAGTLKVTIRLGKIQ